MIEDIGDNYELKDITSKAELADAMTKTRGRVMVLDNIGDLYHIRIVNYVKDGSGRIRSEDEIYKDLDTEDKPFQIETIEGWVSL